MEKKQIEAELGFPLTEDTEIKKHHAVLCTEIMTQDRLNEILDAVKQDNEIAPPLKELEKKQIIAVLNRPLPKVTVRHNRTLTKGIYIDKKTLKLKKEQSEAEGRTVEIVQKNGTKEKWTSAFK